AGHGRLGRGGFPAWHRDGDPGGRCGWCGGGQEGEGGCLGAGDLDEGGGAAVDVAGLPDLEAADDVGVGGEGPLFPGGALVAPGGADELVRGLQHPPGSGQLGQRFGGGGVQDPDPAVGGGRDPVPLVVGGAEALPGLGGDLDPDAQG